MPYYLHHKCVFNNRQVEEMVIELYRKDVESDEVTEIRADFFNVQYLSGDGDKTDSIIPCEATLGIWLPHNSPLDYSDFIITFHDEWLIKAYSDSQMVFTGFLNPSEGEAEFKDKPYALALSATDMLAFLKQEPLANYLDKPYTGTHTLLRYINDILAKTGLDLPMEFRCNLYESSMTTRSADPTKDMLQQAKLHYRSFLKDATTFVSCWDALEMICKETFTFYQWNGRWVMNRFAEMQLSIGPTNWRTEYIDGLPTGVKEEQTFAEVGRNRKLHPIDASGRISSMFPVKSAKHTFNYEVWPEIPSNNKFDRGNIILPMSGPGFTAYTVDDWQYGTFNSLASMALNPTTSIAHRRSHYDAYGIETLREVVLPTNGLAPQKFLLSEGVPVRKGDKVNIGVDFLDTGGGVVGGTQSRAIFYVFLSPDGNLKSHTLVGNGKWKTGINFVEGQYTNGDDEREYHNFEVRSDPMPIDGYLYVGFHNNKLSASAQYRYTNFSFEYLPFIANGAQQVSGDFWYTAQSAPYRDVVNETVGISDSLIKVVKGSLFREDGVNLTTPTWRVDGVQAQKHYKQFTNLGVYNAKYRRQYRISGRFGGTKFSPVSDPTLFEPLSFHRHFSHPDGLELNGVKFMLVPPLSINYKDGEFDGVFVDCINESNGIIGGVPLPSEIIGSLVDMINNTTLAQWQSGTGTPPVGSVNFPPTASVFQLVPRTLVVETRFDSSWFVAADANGAGNNPTISMPLTIGDGDKRSLRIQIGEDIQPGNRFIISLYGIQIVYTVGTSTVYDDGNQSGDEHYFNYTFR